MNGTTLTIPMNDARPTSERSSDGRPLSTGRPRFVSIRTADEIAAMANAGTVVANALSAAAKACVTGATTRDVEAAAANVIREAGAVSLFLNYPSYRDGEGFPGITCVSVNEEVVHGIPSDRVLESNDLVTIDCGVRHHGWCADSAVTVGVDGMTDADTDMVRTATEVLDEAIAAMTPGTAWSAIAERMQARAESAGYGVVRDYVGHGIGRQLHEPPSVPAYVDPGRDSNEHFVLRPGMVLAIEPMLTQGKPATVVRGDGWTVATADGGRACHVEHSVAVTNDGPVILTGRTD